jgi:hypothetical protein
MEWRVCPSVVHLFSTAWSSSVELLDKCAVLNWENSTVRYSVDMPAHPPGRISADRFSVLEMVVVCIDQCSNQRTAGLGWPDYKYFCKRVSILVTAGVTYSGLS